MAPRDDPSFEDLPLTERAREAAHLLGWRAPTPIQVAVIPQLAMGRDLIGRAETGSGKTGAFGLVLTDAVKAPGVQMLVLAPTRELVQQIARDLNALAVGAPWRAAAIYGGVPYEPQLAELRDPATTCIVATTGRLLDLANRKQAILDGVRILVVDEADRMLDLGFLPEVERIIKFIPGERQTALFTATMPKRVAELAHKYMSRPREIEVGRATPESAAHHRVDVPSVHKLDALLALLAAEAPRRALVFVRTRDGARDLHARLLEAGEAAIALHGDLDQSARDAVVAALRAGSARLVVATDVAARGLDIEGITHVINFDVPEDADTYVHRAGRTARAKKQGRVFTIVTEKDGAHAFAAEKAAQVKFQGYVLKLDTEAGPVTITRSSPTPAKREPRGGNASGAKARRAPRTETRRPSAYNTDDDRADAAPEGERAGARAGREFDLPPSRRRRDDDATARDSGA